MMDTTALGTALIYGPENLGYNFGPEHPLQPIRLRLTYELARSLGLLERAGVTLVPPRMSTIEELGLVHLTQYIERVRELSQPGRMTRPSDFVFGLGTDDNPAFEGMHEASAYATGGSIIAADLVMKGEVCHAFNLAGGLHHAHQGYASGFCVYDDAAVAIASVVKNHGARVMYIDFDVHHGDGVQEAFYDSPEVLTVSLHESGEFLFPGTGSVDEIGSGAGLGYAANIPFEPLAGDQVYLDVFRQTIPPLARAFKPDIIFTQMGCDCHWGDPLAHLMMTLDGYRTLYHEVHELVHEVCDGRWAVVGGGGYQVHTVVPKAWTLLFAEMCDVELGDEVPAAWAKMSQQFETNPIDVRLRHDHAPQINEQRAKHVETSALKVIDYIQREVLPKIL